MTTAKKTSKAANAPTEEVVGAAPAYPLDMQLVNDTAQPWVVGGVYVAASSSAVAHVRDEDHQKRIETDCLHILSISDHHKPVEAAEGEEAAPLALRLVQLD